jgi:hypothetical protein
MVYDFRAQDGVERFRIKWTCGRVSDDGQATGPAAAKPSQLREIDVHADVPAHRRALLRQARSAPDINQTAADRQSAEMANEMPLKLTLACQELDEIVQGGRPQQARARAPKPS